MAKPIIAIVGRPNVGKSTLFNKIIGQRISIVEDTPGVTRDRIYAEGTWLDKEFLLVDTGGIEPRDNESVFKHIRQQVKMLRWILQLAKAFILFSVKWLIWLWKNTETRLKYIFIKSKTNFSAAMCR